MRCSTIIYALLTNDIIVLRRCCCRRRRKILSSLLFCRRRQRNGQKWKRTCRACKSIVFSHLVRKFVTFSLPLPLSLFKFPTLRRRGRQRKSHKATKSRNNHAAGASHILASIFAVLFTTTTWNHQIWGFDDNAWYKCESFILYVYSETARPNLFFWILRPPKDFRYCKVIFVSDVFVDVDVVDLKDGAYYCYCANVLRISRYLDFLSAVLINTGIFLRGLKLCGESIT